MAANISILAYWSVVTRKCPSKEGAGDNPEVGVMKSCHLAAMAAVVSATPGQGPAEGSTMGSTGNRAETALCQFCC
jgi:hypothetical protein